MCAVLAALLSEKNMASVVSLARLGALQIVLCAVAASNAAVPSPVLLWSGANHLAARNTYVVEDVDQGTVESFLLQLSKGQASRAVDGLGSLVGPEKAPPGAVVAFLREQLGVTEVSIDAQAYESPEGREWSLERAILGRAVSSAVVPFVYGSDGALDSWAAMRKAASLHLDLRSDVDYEVVKERVAATVDGIATPLLVFRVNENSESIMWVQDMVQTATQGNFIAFLSGVAPQPISSDTGRKMSSPRLLQVEDAAELVGNGTLGVYATTVNPSSIGGMVVSLLLFVLLHVYLCCIAEVQVPTKFVTRYPAMGKEFTGE